MSYDEIMGAIGVGLLLLAFFANTFNIIANEGKIFFVLNIIGSGIACYASWLIHYWPFVILEGMWCIVSLGGLVRRLIYPDKE